MNRLARIPSLPVWRLNWKPAHIRTLRLSLGVTLAMAIAQAFAWPLAFITPVLTTSFMNGNKPCPGLKQGISLLIVIVLACIAGLTISWFLIDYPVICMLVIGVALMNIFYLNSGGFSPFLVVLLLICCTLLPLLAQQSFGLSLLVAFGLLFAALLALLINWLLHGLLPDNDITEQQIENADALEVQEGKPVAQRVKMTLTSLIAVMPVVLIVFTMELTNSALIMIFAVMLAQNPDLQTGYKGCLALIVGNTLGGIVAGVIFSMLIFVPSYGFMLMLTFIVASLCAQTAFSDHKLSPLAGMVLSTVVLLVGSALLSADATALEKFVTRILQILTLTLYIVGAFSLASMDFSKAFTKIGLKKS
ncbi:Predicted membrane protein [Alteromonadaceae bacterium Bs31]|nr:Predicted membrane protein [Alteromonadaceae bacterium Bs31]